MSSPKVIVFGPTGAVGSAAARVAHEKGAQVALAMRDPSKAIPGLDAAAEKAGGFERVTADLTQPESVAAAVKQTGAKRAFIYLAFGMPNGMRATVDALKAAGIELVVLLSSFSVRGDTRDALAAVAPSEFIPYVHSQVEIALEDVYGSGQKENDKGFVALRPGYFASNVSQYKAMFEAGDVKLYAPEDTVDCIVPEDIGAVAGTVLARGVPADGNRRIYLLGPELLSNRATVTKVAAALGKPEVTVSQGTVDDLRTMFAGRGLPPPVVDYMVRNSTMPPNEGEIHGYAFDRADQGNVEKYAGRKPTTFDEWAAKNKATIF